MEELREQLLVMRNLCDVSIVLIEAGKEKLLPTILELIYLEAQQITEEHCIKDEHKS